MIGKKDMLERSSYAGMYNECQDADGIGMPTGWHTQT